MLSLFRSQATTVDRLQADLAGRRKQRSALVEQLAAAQENLSIAHRGAIEIAVDNGGDLDDAEERVRVAERRAQTLASALEQLDGAIASIETDMADRRAASDREQAIKILSDLAARVEAQRARMVAAIEDSVAYFREIDAVTEGSLAGRAEENPANALLFVLDREARSLRSRERRNV